ncbi:MAG: hypothetical protein FP814_02005 [Desulfobacterium sp.]|nr:hypothetical protein [Desulfobacterium sp.]
MKQVINADPYGKIALQGYDAVAFHTIGKAVKGNPAILAEYLGHKYLFSSESNKATFVKEAENTCLPTEASVRLGSPLACCFR